MPVKTPPEFDKVIDEADRHKLVALAYAGKDCAAMLQVMITEISDYTTRNNLGDPEELHAVQWGRIALEAFEAAKSQ